jgi:hypothetical protein
MYKDGKIVISGVFSYSQPDLEFMRDETYHTQEEFREAVFDQFYHDLWEYVRNEPVDVVFEVTYGRMTDG